MKSRFLHALPWLVTFYLLTACATGTPAQTPRPADTSTPEAITTLAPATSMPVPTAAPTAAAIPTSETDSTGGFDKTDEEAGAEVATLLADSLGITGTVTNTIGLEGVRALKLETGKLETDANQPLLWAAYTVGLRNFDTEQNHVLALYTPAGTGWQEIARQTLSASGQDAGAFPAPDYLGDGSVRQVQVEPDNIWLQVEGGVGAHSGVYGLFRWDGETLKAEAGGFSASPGAGRLQDLNGDNIQEVILDASDPYVFCYACGVRLVQYNLLRWDGAAMIPFSLEALPETAPTENKQFNDQLLALAGAGLWKDALAALDSVDSLPADDPILIWNAAYIRLNAEAKRDVIGGEYDQFPILSYVFYGDFAGAVDLMRDYEIDDLFRPDSPLIIGTVAEGQNAILADWIIANTDPALNAQPDLAAAYFLRGWAAYRKDAGSAMALTDLQRAAELTPDDILFGKSVAYFDGGAIQPADPQAGEVAAALAASLGISATEAVTLTPGIEGVYAFKLDTGDGGQPLWLAHTLGLRSFDPVQDHVLAIYTPGADGWQALATLVLTANGDPENPAPSPDYLGEGTVEQVKV
ncbi:MAG: hypothetical protein M3Q45_05780, partial [Chloroflexota bacterium]|nr:hypothetical protein [Chloroflexota bacterium]